MKKKIGITTCVLLTFITLGQQEMHTQYTYSNRVSLLAGLIQPLLLKGANVEMNYTTKRMIFDYSHGMSLDPPSTGTLLTQHLVTHLPFSTGFGIGYRINSYLDVRFEPKLHSWEVYYDGDSRTVSNRIQSYKTFTLGVGVYYRYFPFRNSKFRGLQGITTATSLRFWPNVGSTLSKDAFTYDNKFTGKKETLKAANIGMGNTPFIFNISVGYTFGGK